MNLYLHLADQVGTIAARDLAAQLMSWHDAMVKHTRIVGAYGIARCDDECPHADAPMLWAAAREAFGERAGGLEFLRRHGQRGHVPAPSAPATAAEARP